MCSTLGTRQGLVLAHGPVTFVRKATKSQHWARKTRTTIELPSTHSLSIRPLTHPILSVIVVVIVTFFLLPRPLVVGILVLLVLQLLLALLVHGLVRLKLGLLLGLFLGTRARLAQSQGNGRRASNSDRDGASTTVEAQLGLEEAADRQLALAAAPRPRLVPVGVGGCGWQEIEGGGGGGGRCPGSHEVAGGWRPATGGSMPLSWP